MLCCVVLCCVVLCCVVLCCAVLYCIGLYCIYKDMQIIVILDVLLVKSGELTRIIQADPKLETLCA